MRVIQWKRMAQIVVMAAVGSTASMPAFGQFFGITSPAQYTGVTTQIPVSGADTTNVTTLSAGGQTVTFSSPMTIFTVGASGPGGFNFWGSPPNTESSTPRVVTNLLSPTTLTVTLSVPAVTFGFEVEPINLGGTPAVPFTITASFFNGSTLLGTVSRPVLYNAALLEAASSSLPITSVVITAPLGAGGWAMAQFRFGNILITAAGSPTGVPTLSTSGFGALALLLAAAGALLARSQAAAV